MMGLAMETTALNLIDEPKIDEVKIDEVKIDGEHVADSLRAAGEELDSAGGKVFLDFSAVRRIDPNSLRALEELAMRAERQGIKVGLRGVNVGVYKVLKLAKLASRFCFVN